MHLPGQESEPSETARLRAQALSRWNNEGGAGEGGLMPHDSTTLPPDVLPLTNAELVQMQVRVIALENLLTVLLSGTTERQLDLAREMAAYISPRPGFTPHHLTVRAAARIVSLVERAGHLRALSAAGDEAQTPAEGRAGVDPESAGNPP